MSGSLFIGGTASNVGKSWFTTAFCRLLARRGVRVAPFKAQNMSNNACPCIEGGEIGRSQAAQAEACGLPPMADMNPVLLKPTSDSQSQVVVQGKVWKTLPARTYYEHTDQLFNAALESFERLSTAFDFIVCEGAGSVAEVNLYSRDITNLRFAERVSAPALLVADIERGGVFASLVGTLELLPPGQRQLVRAFAVNRFRGDRSLFDEGVTFLEQRLGIPCLGVFPYAPHITLAAEDGLNIPEANSNSSIAVIHLPHISNFTDFRLLEVDWLDRPKAQRYDTIFLPGTKNTIDDLLWLRAQAFEPWLREQHAAGARIIGICGGYQMLGESIEDPDGFESATTSVEGLSLLPVRTVLRSPKVTRIVEAVTPSGETFPAYEIHMGQTTPDAGHFNIQGRVIGTYLHGAFESPAVLSSLLGLKVNPTSNLEMYDRMAAWLVKYSRPSVLESLIQ